MIRKLIYILSLILVVLIASVFVFGPDYIDRQRNQVIAHTPYPVSEDAIALHKDLLIGDWHADSLLWNRNLLQKNNKGHVDFPRLVDGNVAVQVFAAVTKSPRGQNLISNSSDATDNITLLAVGQRWPVKTWGSLIERAIFQAEKLTKFEADASERVQLIRSADDLEEVLSERQANKQLVGAILGFEGAHILEGEVSNLKMLKDAGYRVIGLHHFFDNELGGSLHGINRGGLTSFGREVVQASIKQNLIIDVAHSSPQVVSDVIAMTDVPIILSHTGLRSHCNTKRNIDDELMRGIASTGGVIGIGFWVDAICDLSPSGAARAIKAAINAVGEDHVSLGSDFDGSVKTGFDVSELAGLTQAMMDIGLSEIQIRKVMGLNMMRVLRERLE